MTPEPITGRPHGGISPWSYSLFEPFDTPSAGVEQGLFIFLLKQRSLAPRAVPNTVEQKRGDKLKADSRGRTGDGFRCHLTARIASKRQSLGGVRGENMGVLRGAGRGNTGKKKASAGENKQLQRTKRLA